MCSHIYQTFYKISFRPISLYLEHVNKVKFCNPNYSEACRLAPGEYITQVLQFRNRNEYNVMYININFYFFKIGQYLITLPQYVDPFFMRENESIAMALNLSDQRYSDANQEESYTNVLLRILSTNTCDVFIEQIQSLKDLNNIAASHLSADIGILIVLINIYDQLIF